MKTFLKRLLSSPVFITCFAFALRMILSYLGMLNAQTPVRTNVPYGFELGHVAAAIASGRGFSSPLRMVQTGPTVWFTPIYPYLVAAIFKICGIYSDLSRLVILTMNAAFASLTIIPIYGIARRTFGTRIAVGAAWAWVVLPTSLYYPIIWVWDTALLALVFSLIFWATLGMREKRGILPWAGYGALWALGVLTNPSILSLFPFFVAWLAWQAHKARVEWYMPVTAALLVFAVCLVPWTVRNYRVFDKFIVLRSNFGLELWLGNNWDVTDTMGQWQHPNDNRAEAEKYQRMGEIAYMAEKEQQSLAFIRTRPLDTLNLIFRRFEINWLAFGDSPADIWSNGTLAVRFFLIFTSLMSLLCMLGVLYAYRACNPEAFPFSITILVFPLIFYVTHASGRYRFPIDPIILILATNAVAYLISFAASRKPEEKNSAAPVASVWGA